MKATLSFGQLAIAVLSISPVVSSVSWPGWLPELDALVVRQDSQSPTSAASPTQTVVPTTAATTNKNNNKDTTSATATATNTNKDGQGGNLNTATREASTTGTHSGGKTSSKSGPAKHTTFTNAIAGSVVMVTPDAYAGSQLYKIGDPVTWGWNYTNVLGTPTAIDVLVSCSRASQTWTLTQNMTFATKGSFTWDTGAYQETAIASPLLTEQYQLLIHDSDSAVTASPEGGYLSPFSGFKFGLYTPRPYTPLADWQCATCSGAMSDLDRKALGAAVAMSAVTVLSFTWFVGGMGAFI
ncbi:hypothetical protein B0T22DRAFT_14063 [Podospora appendiculata]|uniref:DUF7137 domain-containing protein n=1 Tax=Podospora appendiculata TaxID=314037 RepID=A0AAE1CFB8_9PEZI|nr:hypothetical protein B0T22DRAFT_14063 [Podospora appendiculata]